MLSHLWHNTYKKFFILVFFTLFAIFFTNPFLKYPFDMFQHLEWIDLQYGANILPEGRYTWHYFWAKIFYILHIDNTQVFLRAHIIHTSQVLISFFSVFYLAKVVMSNLFFNISSLTMYYLAYWSTLIWFTIFSTSSVGYHQVWTLWYSVNYQITLPLTLLTTGLTLSLIFERLSLKTKLMYSVLIVFFSIVILKIHAMEYLYYLMYLSVIVLSFTNKIYNTFKKHIYYAIPLSMLFILLLILFSRKYNNMHIGYLPSLTTCPLKNCQVSFLK